MAILPQSLSDGTLAMRWRRIAGRMTQDCLLCGSTSSAAIICAACAPDLPRLLQPGCRRCARPLVSAATDQQTCGRCLAEPPHYDATRAAFLYEFPIDKLIQSFKYGHRLALGPYLGAALVALGERPAADLIVPMPLHAARLRQRGFNQALELARPLAHAWQVPIDAGSCQRTRDTAAQAGLPLRERVKNIRGAFHCSTDFTGRRIVLVDDVMTSGASLDECARTLKLHGAVQVTVFVLARALAKSD